MGRNWDNGVLKNHPMHHGILDKSKAAKARKCKMCKLCMQPKYVDEEMQLVQ